MRLVVRRQAPDWQNKVWNQVFSALVEGVPQPPEEPCHRCVRYYGLFTSELARAFNSVGDKYADAGYAAADTLNTADTVRLMAKDGCIPEGFIADVDEAVHKIAEDEHGEPFGEYDKQDVEDATNEIANFGDGILEAVVARCKGPGA